MIDHWDLAGRDVVANLAAKGEAGDPGAAVLYALLSNDGGKFAVPYEVVRTKLRIRKKQVLPELEEQANERIRTYKAFYRALGLFYDDAGVLHSTEFGRELHSLLTEQYEHTDDYAQSLFSVNRRRLARLAIKPLSRYQLANPLSRTQYPPETDIHPLRAIWFAMRQLDNRLHWEELGRALTPCLREADLTEAVELIRSARATNGFDPRDTDQLEALLGPRKPDMGSDQSDRLDSWYSRAAFKNIFLEPRDRSDGYRYLNDEFIDLVDEVLSVPPESIATDSVPEYVEWLGQIRDNESGGDTSREQLVAQIVSRCRRFGKRQIVALVGPAGTGKTTCAWEAAHALTEGDASRISTIQFHAGFTYEEFVAGLAPDDKGGFVPKPGVLLSINKRAHEDEPDKLHVLVIDELSRADVANVLGELLTYIEYRDRKFDVPVLNEAVSIAPNLIVIATLNPADRSVVNMDDALVRRLRQIEVPRSTGALRTILTEAGAEPELIAAVAAWFDSLPADAPFGHGLFGGVRDTADLAALWKESLQYFLRRGGLVVYPDAELIERGYLWKRDETDAQTAPLAAGDDQDE